MTITRNINGVNVEIELTEDELWSAYRERQHTADTCEMLDYWEDGFWAKDIHDYFTDQQISEIADLYRDNLWDCATIAKMRHICAGSAFEEYAKRHGIELKV